MKDGNLTSASRREAGVAISFDRRLTLSCLAHLKPARRSLGLHGIGTVAIKALQRAPSLTAGG
jgi:hypothetical protein